MKHFSFSSNGFSLYVAPLAGAWIETLTGQIWKYKHLVAPLAGAWIETILNCIKS